MASSKFVFPEVVPVGQVRVGVDVTGVAAEDEHAGLVHHRRVVVPGGRRHTIGDGATPGLLLATRQSFVGCQYITVRNSRNLSRVIFQSLIVS